MPITHGSPRAPAVGQLADRLDEQVGGRHLGQQVVAEGRLGLEHRVAQAPTSGCGSPAAAPRGRRPAGGRGSARAAA